MNKTISNAVLAELKLIVAESDADHLLEALNKKGYNLVPVEATEGLLTSMALRYDHSFLINEWEMCPGYKVGYSDDARKSLLTTMKQIHEEVVGTGFYDISKEDRYVNTRNNGGFI